MLIDPLASAYGTDGEDTRPVSDGVLAVTVGAVCFWVLLLYVVTASSLPVVESSFSRLETAIIFLGGILVVYAIERCRRALIAGNRVDALVSGASGAAVLVSSWNLYQHSLELVAQSEWPAIALVSAFTVVLAVGYFTWREFGPVPVGVLALTVAYVLIGPSLPDSIAHGGLEVGQAAAIVTIEGGVYGVYVQEIALTVSLLVLYTTLVVSYGGLRVVRSLGARASTASGVARVWAVGSAVLASISATYLSNASLVGPQSVPALSAIGVRDRTAAGIEAAASTIGQALPPAVLIAGLPLSILAVGLSESAVVRASVFPAAIVFACFLLALHYAVISDVDASPTRETRTSDDASSPNAAFESTSLESPYTGVELGLEFLRFGFPLGVLVGLYTTEFVAGLSSSLVVTIFVTILLGIGVPVAKRIFGSERTDSSRPRTNDDASERRPDGGSDTGGRIASTLGAVAASYRGVRPLGAFIDGCVETARGLRLGVIVLAPVVVLVAAIGVVADLLFAVEAFQLLEDGASALEPWSLGMVGVVLVIALVVTSGLPTVVAASVLGTLGTAALVQDGSTTELWPLFVTLYAAIGAGVAPPVAAAAARTAAGTAASTWESSRVAMGLLAPTYVMPFTFYVHPELVAPSPTLETLRIAVLTLVGGLALVYAINAPISLDLRKQWVGRFVVGLLGVGAMVTPWPAVQAGAAVATVAAVVAIRRS